MEIKIYYSDEETQQILRQLTDIDDEEKLQKKTETIKRKLHGALQNWVESEIERFAEEYSDLVKAGSTTENIRSENIKPVAFGPHFVRVYVDEGFLDGVLEEKGISHSEEKEKAHSYVLESLRNSLQYHILYEEIEYFCD